MHYYSNLFRITNTYCVYTVFQWQTQEFCSRGVQQIQLRTDKQNGDLGLVAP